MKPRKLQSGVEVRLGNEVSYKHRRNEPKQFLGGEFLRLPPLADFCSSTAVLSRWANNRARKSCRFIRRTRPSFDRLPDHCSDQILFRATTSPLWSTEIRFSRLCSAQFDRPNIRLTSRLIHSGT